MKMLNVVCRRNSVRKAINGTCKVAISSMLFLAAGECSALVNWTNALKDNDVAKVGNWSGTDNQWRLNVAGHYKLLSDWTLDGMLFDEGASGKVYYFDFDADRTLTIVGKSRQAIASNGASNHLLNITGGTVLITEDNWIAGANNRALIAPQRQKENTTGQNIIVAAYNRDENSNVRIKTPMVRLGWGIENWFVASNRAEVTVGVLELGSSGPGRGNGFLVDSGATVTFTNWPSLSVGLASTSLSNKFIVSNGGKIAGCNRFAITGGAGGLLAFRGAGTDVKFTGATAKSTIETVDQTLEVSGGAHFTMEGNQGRVWVGTVASHSNNTIMVDGEGSLFQAKGAGFLLGQNSSRNQRVIVSNGAQAEFNSIHVGHGGVAATPVSNNVLRVESGGSVVDTGDMCIGGASNSGAANVYSADNRLEIVGGAVTNQSLYVGFYSNSTDAAVLVDGGTLRSSGSMWGNFRGIGSKFVAKNGSIVDVGGNFFIGPHDENSVWNGANARVEVLSGAKIVT